jgi:hypothetical protein
MAAAAIAVIVLGTKAVQKKREDDSAEGQAKNTAQKVSGSVRKAISAILQKCGIFKHRCMVMLSLQLAVQLCSPVPPCAAGQEQGEPCLVAQPMGSVALQNATYACKCTL